MTNESKETRVFEVSDSGNRGGSHKDVKPSSRTDLVTEFELLSHYGTYGDVVENAINISDLGAEAVLGARFHVRVMDETVELTELSKVFDPEGRRVGVNEIYGKHTVDSGGKVIHYETVHRFDTSGWQPGWYSAEFVIRDLHRDVVSEPATVEFELR